MCVAETVQCVTSLAITVGIFQTSDETQTLNLRVTESRVQQ